MLHRLPRALSACFMSGTMRAARIARPGAIAMERVPRPTPAPGEVLLRIEGTGVCASNLGPWGGLPWIRYPLGPGESGHEAWGVVEEVGRDVDPSMIGTRAVALCQHAYAEYDVAEARTIVALPPELDGRAFPGEAFACAMNIFERSRISPGDTVAIVGVGFLGAILVELAKRRGAEVVAISRRPFALDLAARLGADVCIGMDDVPAVVDAVKARTRGRLCDRVIEAVGKQGPLDLATELARERGLLVVAGYHQDGPRQVNMQLWNWRGLDVVNAHERDPMAYVRGMQLAVDAVRRGELVPETYVTDAFPLEALDRALDATERRPDGFLKAVVRP